MMKRLTEEDIVEINNSKGIDHWLSGIFKEPFGVPNEEKRLLVYSRYETGGYSCGNCWGDSAEPYVNEKPDNHFKVLDLVLEKIAPTITYLEYKKITELIHSNTQTDWEYYGNSTDWAIEYIVLEELYEHFNI
jgi:hypothetical protein